MPPIDYEYASGVLPYCNFNNNIYFLLGKSRRSGRLITFSGKNNEFDTSTMETAAREFFEETLGAVMDRQSMAALLAKCPIVLTSKTPRGQPCYTYVVEVPFRKHYAMCFTRTRSFLEAIHLRSPEFLEMCDIKWVCARTMLTKIRRNWEKSGTLTESEQWQRLIDLCNLKEFSAASWRARTFDDTDDEPN